MRAILLIARRELASFFRTPSGYAIAALVMMLDGIIFNISVGSTQKLSAEILTDYFLWAGSVSATAAVALTTRLLSDEGPQVLLMTAPVREVQIVLGKFLSALAFLTFVTLITLYLPALIFVHGKVSIGHIAAGYIGMILLGSASLSLGLFGSALSKSPIVGLVLASVLVATLHLFWFVARMADPPMDSVLEHMALYYKHFMPFRNGLLQLSDVVYYVGVTWVGLLGSTLVLKGRRWQ